MTELKNSTRVFERVMVFVNSVAGYSSVFRMSAVSYLVLFFISHLLLVSLAQEEEGFSSKCQPFYCGNLGHIKFPFSNGTHPECGFLRVDHCNETFPSIQLGNGVPKFYVSTISEDDTLTLQDRPGFEKPPLDNSSCVESLRNFTIPSSPFMSFELLPNIQTVFKCPGTHYSLPVSYDAACNDSKHSIIFYNGSNHQYGSSTVPSNCSLIPFKMNKTEKGLDFLNLYTGNLFQLQVNVTRECRDCHFREEGNCQIDHEGKFHCLNARTGDANLGLKLLMLGIAAAVAAIGILIILAFCFSNISQRNCSMFFWKKKTKNYQNIEVFLKEYGSLAPKRYTYLDIKKMTNSFKDKLGEGGYGGVYKGVLLDGRYVAVKVLNESKGDGEEFINEVASISRTSHVNIVALLGFCFEGCRRALIYEFVPNGSLEKFIYEERPSKTDHQLKWGTLYQIAVGIARGLEYLHRGCSTRILHFDIKPHNILLDEDFCPKISDFGLAKICLKKESNVSMTGARGTVGYIAPELFNRNFGEVSHKSDVYSYGMMVLEMVGGKNNTKLVDHAKEIYFPHWIYNRLEIDEDLGLQGITSEEDNESSRKMIIVSLWCIQTNPLDRPTMSRVVDMLEGSLDCLQIPPKPFLSSPRSRPDSSITLFSYDESK